MLLVLVIAAMCLAFPLARASASELAEAPIAMRVDHIPYGPERLAAMAAYSLRHYGESTWRLTPRAIVLHYTCGPSFASAWYTFARNRPHNGELPGVCAHYIVDPHGTVHEVVPPEVRCRHATGMNHVAIGVEFVQRCMRGGARMAEREMLARTPQMEAGIQLVRALQRRFSIANDRIVGHAMVNRSPLFLDHLGLTNDHGDWRGGAVREFVRRLDASTERP